MRESYILWSLREAYDLGFCFQAMESKLLVGGKNIVDHTNEQQKILEQKRQEIAEQVQGRTFVILYKKPSFRTSIKHCIRRNYKKICPGLTLKLV